MSIFAGSKMVEVSLTEIEKLLVAGEGVGLSYKDMARIRGRSPSTINQQWRNIKDKLGAETRTRAVVIAIRDGII
jgi:DNA-binding CsgD family transcriptional regulator